MASQYSEWSSNSRFNPFNTHKVLRHLDYWAPIYHGKIPPPLAVTIDPSMACNYSCPHCNVVDEKREAIFLTKSELERLPKMLKEFGVRSVTLAGGGEPLCNNNLDVFFRGCKENELDYALITNGSLLENYVDTLVENKIKWVGVSVDASSPKTYSEIKGIYSKGINQFHRVTDNILDLTCRGVEVGYKYLLSQNNVAEVYTACKLAKSLGCSYIHIRPASPTLSFKPKFTNEQVKEVLDTITAARAELECKTFRIYGITHKFGDNFKVDNQFDKCWSSFMYLVIQPGVRLLTCCDTRGTDKALLADNVSDVSDIPKIWGSDKHIEMVSKIDPKTCARCTFNFHNQAFENMVINDKTDSYFI